MTPIFVWRTRTSVESQSSGSNCLNCGFPLRRIFGRDEIQLIKFDELDNSMLRILKEHYLWRTPSLVEAEYVEPGIIATAMAEELSELDQLYFFPTRYGCPRCGWWKQGISSGNEPLFSSSFAALKEFDINDSELALAEIRSHLTGSFSDIFSLSPRKFEEVVGDIYRSLGWNVTLTAQSRDGGIDLFCLSKSSGEVCIVECKRYKKNCRVGIGALDRLLGAQLRNNAQSAHLVTSTSFSKDAIKAAAQAHAQGINLKLVDAHELFHLLKVYTEPSTTIVGLQKTFAKKKDDE